MTSEGMRMSSHEVSLVPDLLESQVRERPGAVAVRDRAHSLTYQELHERSGRLAARLISLGVGPEVPVGVHLDRRVNLVVSFFAVLKAGGAYVPLDPVNPASRVAQIIEDAAIAHVIADRPVPGAASGVASGVAV